MAFKAQQQRLRVYDTTTQTVAVANTFQDITFNTNVEMAGWTHTAGTASFTCTVAGTYLVIRNNHMQKTGGANTTGETVAVINGAQVAGSQTGRSLVNNNQMLSTVSQFYAVVVVGDVLKIQFTGGTTSVEIGPSGATATVRPSANVVIIRIA